MSDHRPTGQARRVSAAQRRVLEDLARGGRGHGRDVAVTVVPMRCLVRDGLVTAPAGPTGGFELTDAGRAALADAREADAAAHGLTVADDGPVPVDLDALAARLAGGAG